MVSFPITQDNETRYNKFHIQCPATESFPEVKVNLKEKTLSSLLPIGAPINKNTEIRFICNFIPALNHNLRECQAQLCPVEVLEYTASKYKSRFGEEGKELPAQVA